MGNSSDSSDDGKSSRFSFKKLDRNNWAEWKTRFENVITAKGYEDIMKDEWVKDNKDTSDFRQMSAWCMNKLYSLVKEELHPVWWRERALAKALAGLFGGMRNARGADAESTRS
ncbi:uncharacterized protein PGTG_21938 [Puccinia graminis f. sp. tritici CRL 75-36-700-3]|uniref:DUF4219 domain-containing protein n=1 Tax=Puccinia graminis f. sp. tritici (strain CRL 75-36-700-3 / race SCCL) TaxID=418459 RepID=H6QSW5_PUCGT|nr:uncharacterized protein PGTG_21938 [Puccinia graminis f. sp. tritici CRL 75-36-700-3]EHS63919.1 hypothetical protein PGTG_21938 [Puccinia graminis f. sp. tritici CRL 75-36-700-3]